VRWKHKAIQTLSPGVRAFRKRREDHGRVYMSDTYMRCTGEGTYPVVVSRRSTSDTIRVRARGYKFKCYDVTAVSKLYVCIGWRIDWILKLKDRSKRIDPKNQIQDRSKMDRSSCWRVYMMKHTILSFIKKEKCIADRLRRYILLISISSSIFLLYYRFTSTQHFISWMQIWERRSRECVAWYIIFPWYIHSM